MTEEETAAKLSEELEKLFKQKREAQAAAAAAAAPLPIAEIFTESNFTHFDGQLGNVAIEIAGELSALMEHDAPILAGVPASDNTAIAKHYYIRGILGVSKQILAFLRAELETERNVNQLSPSVPTKATPSENRFIHVGVTALDVLLTYHNAAHYCDLIEQGKITPATTDNDFATLLHTRCHVLEVMLKLLAEKCPEMATASEPSKFVN